jgi:hypothetical protein
MLIAIYVHTGRVNLNVCQHDNILQELRSDV